MLIKLPPNVAALAKLASKDEGKYSMVAVRMRQTEDGCRLEATDGKKLGIVELVGGLVPDQEFDDCPNGATEVLIPTEEFVNAVKKGRPDSLWQLGSQRVTVETGLKGTRTQITPLEGRWPEVDLLVRDFAKPPLIETWVNAEYLRDLLNVAMMFTSSANASKVILRYWAPHLPLAVQCDDGEGQRFFGIIMPLSGSEVELPKGTFLILEKELAACEDVDKVAPVSGKRCRSCQAVPSAKAKGTWLIEYGAAYCFDCKQYKPQA